MTYKLSQPPRKGGTVDTSGKEAALMKTGPMHYWLAGPDWVYRRAEEIFDRGKRPGPAEKIEVQGKGEISRNENYFWSSFAGHGS